MFTYAFAPNRDEKRRIGIWDELVAGTDNKKAWLGKAKGPAIHLATRTPDLLDGIHALFPPFPEITGMQLRGKPEQELDKECGASVRYVRSLKIGDKFLPCLQVHPPYKAVKGSTHWGRDVQLVRDSDLRFSIGMAPLSPERSGSPGSRRSSGTSGSSSRARTGAAATRPRC